MAVSSLLLPTPFLTAGFGSAEDTCFLDANGCYSNLKVKVKDQ